MGGARTEVEGGGRTVVSGVIRKGVGGLTEPELVDMTGRRRTGERERLVDVQQVR